MSAPRYFGRYELLGTLGSGSFATVYRARDPLLGREVALKALRDELARDAEDRARFTAEARALAAIQHPNIVTVYDVGEDDGRPYFTMEIVDGLTLSALNRLAPLSLAEALAILVPLAAAIDRVHEAGLVHRDLKGDNVIVTPGGRVVLMDFGIALSLAGPRLTAAGTGLGTPESAAPEQVQGDDVGPAADIYALGVLAYQLLSGGPPFSGDTAHVLYAHAHLAPPSVREGRPDLPEALDAAIAAALAKDPARRPRTAAAFVRQLTAAASAPPACSPGNEGAPPSARIEGHGSGAAVRLHLRQGFTTFHLAHQTERPALFRVTLLSADGAPLRELVQSVRSYDGTAAWTAPSAGDYALAIVSDGAWYAEIEQPDIAALTPVTSAAGTGDGVVYLALPAGVQRLLITHQVWDGTLFRVTLLDSRGEQPDRLVATTGPYRGSVERRIGTAGTHLLVIEAEGAWSVAVK